ncbi:Arginine--tRNA ligase [compost metagenome]
MAIPSPESVNLQKLTAEHEYDLLRKMGELPEEIGVAAENYAPHRLVRYVYEISAMLHSYYRAERVITEDAEQTAARLVLLGAVRTVIANVLKLIGVSAPERM